MNELDDLERRLAARVTAPDARLRGRVLDALERRRRAESRDWFATAAAAWLVVGLCWWAGRDPRSALPPRRSITDELARGPDLAHVPRLARPIRSHGSVSP